MGYYATNCGNFLPTFRDNISVPSSGFKNLDSFRFLAPEDGTEGCPETSVISYHCSLRNDPEERNYHIFRGGRLKSPLIQEMCKSRSQVARGTKLCVLMANICRSLLTCSMSPIWRPEF